MKNFEFTVGRASWGPPPFPFLEEAWQAHIKKAQLIKPLKLVKKAKRKATDKTTKPKKKK